MGFLTTKSIEGKPLARADVVWGFDPHRFDHARMGDAIRWVLGDHFDLELDGSVGNEPDPEPKPLPTVTQLRRCRPNPFNPSTTISYEMRAPGRVELSIFDMRGRLVALLVDEAKTAGAHETVWRGVDDAGRSAAAGTYLIRLRTGDEVRLRTATLLK